MKVFSIDNFVEWMVRRGLSEHEARKHLEINDWGKYDLMTYEEVIKEVPNAFNEWFKEDK